MRYFSQPAQAQGPQSKLTKAAAILWIGIMAGCSTQQPAASDSGTIEDGSVVDVINPEINPENNVTSPIDHRASPFGVHPSSKNNYAYADELGVHWNREGAYFIWSWADPDRKGSFSFKNALAPPRPDGSNEANVKVNYDAERLRLNKKGMYLMANVCPFMRGGAFANEQEKESYSKFVKALVERYDGDDDFGCSEAAPDCFTKGDDEHPSQELIQSFNANPTRFWQVCNQVTDTCSKQQCADDEAFAQRYAEVQRITYEAVKAADNSAQVLIAGDSARQQYPSVYAALAGKYIDIVDFHRFGQETDYDPEDDLDFLKTSLSDAGFDLAKLRFWITETGTYSGDPVKDTFPPSDGLPYQSEKQQARGLLKIHVAALALGVEKVLWAWSIIEGFNCNCCIFDYTGLVYDGNAPSNSNGCDKDDPYDLGQGVKKLSYFTYKKMVEQLDGTDWKSIEVIRRDEDVRVYRFADKTGASVWVAWNDGPQPTTITVDLGVDGASVVVTEAIPKFAAGNEVTEYASAFAERQEPSAQRSVTVTLGDVPVYIRAK